MPYTIDRRGSVKSWEEDKSEHKEGRGGGQREWWQNRGVFIRCCSQD